MEVDSTLSTSGPAAVRSASGEIIRTLLLFYGSQGNISRLGVTSVSPCGVLGGVLSFDKVLTRSWFADVTAAVWRRFVRLFKYKSEDHFHLWRIYCSIAPHFIDSLSAHRLFHLSV